MKYAFMAFAILLFSSTAGAEDGLTIGAPFPAQWWVCDTEEQVNALDQAHEQGGTPLMKQLFDTLQATPNQDGDPTCGTVRGQMTILMGYPSLTPDIDGAKRWVVRVAIGGMVYWSLYRGPLIGAHSERPVPEQSSAPSIGVPTGPGFDI